MYHAQPLTDDKIHFITEIMSEDNNISALHTKKYSLSEWENIFKESKKDTDEENFIIYNNDIPCAWLKLNGLNNKDTAWISMLVVSGKCKHQGIGGFAVNFAVEYLKQREYKHIKLQTTTDNLIAIGLYSKCGFIIVNQSKTKITMSKEV